MAGGASAIADILSHSDRQTERQILGELESQDSELVEQIRASLFTFDDVIALDARSLQQILRRVPTSTLAAALKGAQLDADAMAHIRGNLTERGAQTLDEELEVLGAIRSLAGGRGPGRHRAHCPGARCRRSHRHRPQRRGRVVTTRRGSGSAVAAPVRPRILEGQGLSVRRRPLDPGRPIDYASLSTCAPECRDGAGRPPVTRPVTPTGGEKPRKRPGTPNVRALARVDKRRLRPEPHNGCGPLRLRGTVGRARESRAPVRLRAVGGACSGGSRSWPSIRAATRSPGRSRSTKDTFRPSPGCRLTMRPPSGTSPISHRPAH